MTKQKERAIMQIWRIKHKETGKYFVGSKIGERLYPDFNYSNFHDIGMIYFSKPRISYATCASWGRYTKDDLEIEEAELTIEVQNENLENQTHSNG